MNTVEAWTGVSAAPWYSVPAGTGPARPSEARRGALCVSSGNSVSRILARDAPFTAIRGRPFRFLVGRVTDQQPALGCVEHPINKVGYAVASKMYHGYAVSVSTGRGRGTRGWPHNQARLFRYFKRQVL